MITVTKAAPLPWKRLERLWEQTAGSRWYSNFGPQVCALEKELSDFTGIPGTCLVTNGHIGLELAIEALGLGHDPVWNEVVTTPFTFPSTTLAILREGLKPVFCDVDPATGCMDPAALEEQITDRTAAILPVQVYGNVCDDRAIRAVAGKHRLPVIYDAAHAFGERVERQGAADGACGERIEVQEAADGACGERRTDDVSDRESPAENSRNEDSQNNDYHKEDCQREDGQKKDGQRKNGVSGRSVLSLGTISCCSFHATKVFTTAEGGGVFSVNSALTDRVRCLANFGLERVPNKRESRLADPWIRNGLVGTNAKMDEFRAAIGRCLLPDVMEMTARRERRVQKYLADLSGTPGLRFVLPRQVPRVFRNYGYCPVLIEPAFGAGRDIVCQRLLMYGIQARKYFSPLVPDMPGIRTILHNFWNEDWDDETTRQRCPNARYLAEHVLCLPVFPDLPLEEVDRICGIIRGMRRG